MKNFGNVKEEFLSFEKGLTLFSGDNGQGKSTVLRCLALLLFNQTSGKLSDYIRWGTESFSISTEFTYLGNDIKVTFDYSEKVSDRRVFDLINNEEYQGNRAIAFLDDLLDFNRAKASIISFENEIDLITTSPAERREYLKKIYDLNFKEELQAAAVDGQNLKEKTSILEGEVISLESQTFDPLPLDRLPFNHEAYSTFTKNLEGSRNKLYQLEDDKKQYEENKAKLEKLENDQNRLNQDIKNINSNISDIDNNLSKYENDNELLVLDLSAIEKEQEDKKKEFEDKKQSINVGLEDVKVKKNSLDVNYTDENLSSKLIEDLRNEAKDKEKALNELIHEKEHLTKHLETFETGICPTCEQVIEESMMAKSKQRLNEVLVDLPLYEKESNDSDNKLVELENKIREVKNEFNDLNRKEDKYNNELKLLNDSLANLDETYNLKKSNETASYDHQKELIAQKIDNLKNEKKFKNESIEKLKEDLDRIKKDINEIPSIGGIDDIEKDISQVKEEIEKLDKDIKSYDSIMISNEEKKKFNALQEQKSKERDETLELKKKEIEECKIDFAKTETAIKILSKDFPSFVISKMVKSLSFYVNEFLSQVYPHYEIEVVENKSSLRVLYGPEKSDVKLASGFEQQVFSFAWKYALGKIQNYALLILDEVDSAASEENSEKFYETLAKMESYFEQIFIVTHKQDIKDLLANDYQATVYNVVEGVYERVV